MDNETSRRLDVHVGRAIEKLNSSLEKQRAVKKMPPSGLDSSLWDL